MRQVPWKRTLVAGWIAAGLTLVPPPGGGARAVAEESGGGTVPPQPIGRSFDCGVEIPVDCTSGPNWVATARMDGDSLPDLVVSVSTKLASGLGGGAVQVRLGRGDGTFLPPAEYALGNPGQTGWNAGISVAEDFDGDGDTDVVCASGDQGRLATFRNDGTGALTRGPDIVLDPGATGTGLAPTAFVAANLDTRDGGTAFELVVGVASTRSLRVLGGNLLGGTPTTLCTLSGDAASLAGPTFATSADLDDDAHRDLVVFNRSTHTLTLLQGNGAGGVTVIGPDIGTGDRSPGYARTCVAADFNGDGRDDIATPADGESRGVGLMLSRVGGSTYVYDPGAAYPTLPGSGFLAVARDFDDDGKIDLAVSLVGWSQPGTVWFSGLVTLKGRGDGTFEAPVNVTVGAEPYGLASDDLDGDRRPDLVTANTLEHGLSVRLNDGRGGFLQRSDVPAGARPRGIARAKLNGDDIDDLVVALSAEDRVGVLIGRAGGGFEPVVSYPVGPQPYAVAVGDLNGDGVPDLAVADCMYTTRTGVVSVLLGNEDPAKPGKGDGTFGPEQRFDAGMGMNPVWIAIDDLDGDGAKDDVVTGNYYPGDITILLNSGSGTVDLRPNPGSPHRSGSTVAPGSAYEPRVYDASVIPDLDDDRIPEIVTASMNSSSIGIHLSKGGPMRHPFDLAASVGFFDLSGAPGALPNPTQVMAANVVGDGLADLVVLRHPNTISILRGVAAAPYFEVEPEPVPGAWSRLIAVGNFAGALGAGDSHPDIAAAGVHQNHVPSTHNVAILPGDGNGHFGTDPAAVIAYEVAHGPYVGVAGEFTGDNLTDLAVTCPADGRYNGWTGSVVSVLGGLTRATPLETFVWQTIRLDLSETADGGPYATYQVIVEAEQKPPDPFSFVYPSTHPNPKLRERKIQVVDADSRVVVHAGLLRRKLLAYAHNAAVYRGWAASAGDPAPMLSGRNPVDGLPYVAHIETSQRSPYGIDSAKFPGGTHTDFSDEYPWVKSPGFLRFPREYLVTGADSVLVDWNGDMALAVASRRPDLQELILRGVLPGLGLAADVHRAIEQSHPVGLVDTPQRRKVYRALLEELALQSSVGGINDDLTERLRRTLEAVLPGVEAEDVDAARNVKQLVDALQSMQDLATTSTSVRRVSSALARIRFTPKQLQKIAGKAAATARVADVVSIGLDVGFLAYDVLGDGFAALVYADAVRDRGVRNATSIGRIGLLIDPTLDPALGNAWADVQPELEAALRRGALGQWLANLEKGGGAYIWDVAQIALSVASLGTGPAAPLFIVANLGISVVRFGWETYWDKIHLEEAQQGVVLAATLEREWFEHGIREFVEALPREEGLSRDIDHINRLVSCRIYLAALVADRALESDSPFLRQTIDSPDLDARRAAWEALKDSLVAEYRGLAPSRHRVAGREYSGGSDVAPSYIGFVPRPELDALDRLATASGTEFTRKLRVTLRGPAEFGITDEAGRRVGRFAGRADGLAEDPLNQIPGASFTASEAGVRILEIPETASGTYAIEIAGTGEDAITVEAETFRSALRDDLARVTGAVGASRRLDGTLVVSVAGNRHVVSFRGGLVTRGKATGICLDARTGEPCHGAEITVSGAGLPVSLGAITSTDGRYRIDGIPPGRIQVTAHVPGYEPATHGAIDLSPFGTVNSEFLLWPVEEPLLGLEESELTAEAGDRTHDEAAGVTSVVVRVVNGTSDPVQGPLCLVIEGLGSGGVSPLRVQGTTYAGAPYIDLSALVPSGVLGAGESVTATLEFQNSAGGVFEFVPRVIARPAACRLIVSGPAVTPDFVTHRPVLGFSGAADGFDASAGIRFSTDRGRSGLGTGSGSWTADVQLEAGANRVEFAVTGLDGAIRRREFRVEFRPVYVECRDGISLVSLPASLPSVRTASDLLRELVAGGASVKALMSMKDGAMRVWMAPGMGVDFPVEIGGSYFVIGARHAPVPWYGDALLSEPVRITLYPGNNFVGLPVLPRAVRRASDLAAEIAAAGGEVVAISRMREGAAEPYVPGISANDFEVRPGDGLMIGCRKGCEWSVRR